ncbi:MAG: TlpA family protein disulfide reductase [Acidobacteria bacterium]|nr:TlpA family protein disulfide reductase [Acidobacteriota bacterium]
MVEKLLFFFETDCPTCRLAAPYLNRLGAKVTAISQDGEEATAEFVRQTGLRMRVEVDDGLRLSRRFDPEFVPALYLLDGQGQVLESHVGFDKEVLNRLAAALGSGPIADPYDGAPSRKPGCGSRHREGGQVRDVPVTSAGVSPAPATRMALDDSLDPIDYCRQFGDPLPVVPPTVERVERMLRATPLPAQELVARVPPNYGAATVEKIAANAVMAGCAPEMMRVLIPLVRAACDERFNIHGIQATTHFAAPLIIVNGPVRKELGFACGSNVFSNVARANSTLGRALQLILTNLGGARPGEIDMSALGNPGKFSYCIAENEEQSPWPPLHDGSAVTLFAAEPPHGVSEHTARSGREVLKTICYSLATVWNYRSCAGREALVVIGPEHARTIARDGITKDEARQLLFDNTGVPLRVFENTDAEGTQLVKMYQEITIDGQRCYRKFQSPEAIHIVVAGGTAGKFSAVIGSWATGTRGSLMVTYPV